MKRALVRLAKLKSGLMPSALCIVAPLKLAPVRLAPMKLGLVRCALEKSALVRSLWEKLQYRRILPLYFSSGVWGQSSAWAAMLTTRQKTAPTMTAIAPPS
jgi:hypothetical protein